MTPTLTTDLAHDPHPQAIANVSQNKSAALAATYRVSLLVVRAKARPHFVFIPNPDLQIILTPRHTLTPTFTVTLTQTHTLTLTTIHTHTIPVVWRNGLRLSDLSQSSI